MPPLPRFTSHHYPLSNQSYVFDRLLYRRVRIEGSGLIAAHLAHVHEAAWRRQCEQWRQAEHRDGPL